MQRRIPLKNLNPLLTCTICTGYLVDATTIVECLHSFCRSCIIRHLELSYDCPKCNTEIHKTKPFEYIRSDPSLQEVVYKLVPDLYQKEVLRKSSWGTKRNGIKDGEDREENTRILVTLKYFRGTSRMERIKTERVLIMFPTRYLCCQQEMPIRVLKKFVQYKFDISTDLFTIEIWRGDEILLNDLTLKQLVQIYGLFRERKPLELHYSLYPKFNLREEKPANMNILEFPQFPQILSTQQDEDKIDEEKCLSSINQSGNKTVDEITDQSSSAGQDVTMETGNDRLLDSRIENLVYDGS